MLNRETAFFVAVVPINSLCLSKLYTMKKAFLLVVLTILANVGMAQTDTAIPEVDTVYVPEITTGPGIRIFEETYDFGKLLQGSGEKHEFIYMNIGSEPLTITKVVPPCGSCMTVFWPQNTEVLPGKKGVILVQTATGGYTGSYDKVIAIQSNAVNEPQKTIQVKARIEVPKE